MGTRNHLLSVSIVTTLLFSFLCSPTQAATLHHNEYIDGPFGQIHVRVFGESSQPTIILMHKMVMSSLEFERVQPILARLGYRTIAVDLPGYGLSDAPVKEPTANDYAEAMLPVLAHFHLEHATFLGSDTGAVISLAFAVLHPERVDHLIMDGVPLFSPEETKEWLDEKPRDRTPTADGSEFAHRAARPPNAVGGGASPAAIQLGTLEFFAAAPNYLYAHHAIFKFPLAQGLKDDKVKTMVLMYPGKGSWKSLPTVRAIRPDLTYVIMDFKEEPGDFDDAEPWAKAVVDYLKGS